MPRNEYGETLPDPAMVGRYARNVESNWLGKIVACEGDFYKMQGVDELCHMVAGGDREAWLCDNDFQWMVHDDLVFQP